MFDKSRFIYDTRRGQWILKEHNEQGLPTGRLLGPVITKGMSRAGGKGFDFARQTTDRRGRVPAYVNHEEGDDPSTYEINQRYETDDDEQDLDDDEQDFDQDDEYQDDDDEHDADAQQEFDLEIDEPEDAELDDDDDEDDLANEASAELVKLRAARKRLVFAHEFAGLQRMIRRAFGLRVEEVLAAVRELGLNSSGLVKLSDLGQKLGVTPQQLETLVNTLRRQGKLTGSGSEGRQRLTTEDQRWQIDDISGGGHQIGAVSLRSPLKRLG